MHTIRHLFAAIALTCGAAAIGSAASAAELTREEVKAAVLQARASGELQRAGESGEPFPSEMQGPARTRAQVRAETLEARVNGELTWYGECVPAEPGATCPKPQRSQVRMATERR